MTIPILTLLFRHNLKTAATAMTTLKTLFNRVQSEVEEYSLKNKLVNQYLLDQFHAKFSKKDMLAFIRDYLLTIPVTIADEKKQPLNARLMYLMNEMDRTYNLCVFMFPLEAGSCVKPTEKNAIEVWEIVVPLVTAVSMIKKRHR